MAFSDSSGSMDMEDDMKSEASDNQFGGSRHNMSMKRDSVRVMTPRLRSNSIGSNCGRRGSGLPTPVGRGGSLSGLPLPPTFTAQEDSSSAPSTPLSLPAQSCSGSGQRPPPASIPTLRIPMTPDANVGGMIFSDEGSESTPHGKDGEMIESASEGPGSPEGGIETESAGDDGVDETDICSSSGTEMDGDNDNNNNDNDTPEETPSPYCAHTRRATVPVSEHRVKPARLDPELVQKSPKLPASNSHRNVGFVPVSYTTPPPLPAPPRPKERRASEAGDATSEEKSASPSQTAETASVLSEAQATVRTQQAEIAKLKAENAALQKSLEKAESENRCMVDQMAQVVGKMTQDIETERSRSPRSPRPGNEARVEGAEARLFSIQTDVSRAEAKLAKYKNESEYLEQRVVEAKADLGKQETAAKEAAKEAKEATSRRMGLQKEHASLEAKIREAKDKHTKVEAEVADIERRAKRDRLHHSRQNKEAEVSEKAAAECLFAEKEVELKVTCERLCAELSDAKTKQAWSDAVLDRLGIPKPHSWSAGNEPSANIIGSAKLRQANLKATQLN